jgi:hypothetical protein
MDLIQIRDGKPYEHPILGENFRQAFPHIDTNNLPPEFARFQRVRCPFKAGFYEVDVVSYEWDNEIVKDVWTVRPMTPEEKEKKLAEHINSLNITLAQLKEYAQNRFNEAESDKLKQIWQEYINKLESFNFDSFDDISKVRMPVPPMPRDVASTTEPGSTPDVTG